MLFADMLACPQQTMLDQSVPTLNIHKHTIFRMYNVEILYIMEELALTASSI